MEGSIIAQTTPNGPGVLAILCLSGDDAFAIADKMTKLPHGKTISTVKSHTIQFGWVVDEHGNHIDQVLFLIMKGPKTFVGHDTIEINCHNNPFIIQAIMDRAIACGARLATNGEFSKRAFLNGKIDLLQAESLNELINANTQMNLKQALSQLEGSFSHFISGIEQTLLQALSYCEVSFDYLDDDQISFDDRLKALIIEVKEEIYRLKKKYNQQQQIRNGIRIALIGAVNAGKSSLFNALLQDNRAIVTEIAGTTRDAIEAGMYKQGAYWTLIDTAGIRQTDDIVEKEGIKKSLEQAALADLIILTFDASRKMTDQERTFYETIERDYEDKVLLVATKSDLPVQTKLNDALQVSSKKCINIDALETRMQEKIDVLLQQSKAPFLLNQRHYNTLSSLENILKDIENLLKQPDIAYELVSVHLNDSLQLLSSLTGKSVSEKSMDAIFSTFCVGK